MSKWHKRALSEYVSIYQGWPQRSSYTSLAQPAKEACKR